MAVNVSGAILASLFYDHSESQGDQCGFLIGEVFKHVTDTISDSQINNLEVETKIYIYECVPCPKDQRFYNASGHIQEQRLKDLLKDRLKSVIGWYSFRRNSTLRPSFKERLLHENLAKSVIEDPSMFTLLLCSAKASTNKSTHSFDHTFLQLANNVFKRMAVNVVNLGDTTHTEYKYLPSHTVSSSHGVYNLLVQQQEEAFLNTHGQMEVRRIQALNGAFSRKLEDITKGVVDSEIKLDVLEQEVRKYRKQVRLKLLEKQQKQSAISGKTTVTEDTNMEHDGTLPHLLNGKKPSVDDILSMDFDFIDDDGLKDQGQTRDLDKVRTINKHVLNESGALAECVPLIRTTTNASAGADNSGVNNAETQEIRLTSPVSLHKRSNSSAEDNGIKDIKLSTIHTRSRSNDSCMETNDTKAGGKKSSDPFEFVSSILAKSKKDDKEKSETTPSVLKGGEAKIQSSKKTDAVSMETDDSGVKKDFSFLRKNATRGHEAASAAARSVGQQMKTRGQKSQNGPGRINLMSNPQGDTNGQKDIEIDVDTEKETDLAGNKKSKGRAAENNVKNCSQEAGKKGGSSEVSSDDTASSQDTFEMDVSSSPVY